jgi:hypothetical protein
MANRFTPPTERDCTPPRCPPNRDAYWEVQCHALNTEARQFDAAGETDRARAAEHGAAAAYCRIQNPARQKRLGAELWGLEHP